MYPRDCRINGQNVPESDRCFESGSYMELSDSKTSVDQASTKPRRIDIKFCIKVVAFKRNKQLIAVMYL